MLNTRKEKLELYLSLARSGVLRLMLPVTTLDQERKIAEICQDELMGIEETERDLEQEKKIARICQNAFMNTEEVEKCGHMP